MARDYAKMYAGRNRRAAAGRTRYWLAGLLCLALIAGLLVLLHHVPLRGRKNPPVVAAAVPPAGTGEKEPPAVAHPVAFDFYNTLPAANTAVAAVSSDPIPAAVSPAEKETATIAVASITPASTAKPVKALPPVHYVLQLGVFADRKAAARSRLNFLLAGVDSIIVRETSEGDRVLFRIQQGAYPSEKAARVAATRYRRRGVESIVRKVVDIDENIPT